MRRNVLVGVAAAVVLFPAAGAAQLGFGFAPHVGTLGIGLDVSASVAPRVALRVGGNIIPSDVSLTVSDIEFDFDFPSPQFTAMLDLVLVGGLRASGGVLLSSQDINVIGTLLTSVEIGNTTYQASDVGTLSGSIVNQDLAPYLGIGFGNPGSSRFGFFMDLGVAFHGAPEVTLSANGPISGDPTFQAELEAERAQFESDISWLDVYPVVKIGFSIGFPSVPMVPGV